jgi:plasmid maintenance system killer protein
LKFNKLPPHKDLWSVRINHDYRAIGRWRGDVLLWFFIGSHADYDRLMARL